MVWGTKLLPIHDISLVLADLGDAQLSFLVLFIYFLETCFNPQGSFSSPAFVSNGYHQRKEADWEENSQLVRVLIVKIQLIETLTFFIKGFLVVYSDYFSRWCLQDFSRFHLAPPTVA